MAYDNMFPADNGNGNGNNNAGNADMSHVSGTAGKPKHGGWCSAHPWLTAAIVLFLLATLPSILLGLFVLAIKLAVFALFILVGIAMSAMAVKIIDNILNGDDRPSRNSDATGGRTAMRKSTRDWKSKHSYAPDRMLELADNGNILARDVAAAYDSMLDRLHEAGEDPDIAQAEYVDRMNAMADGIELYVKVQADRDSYPDADALLETIENAADALMEQFDATVRKANLAKTTEAELKMQTIMNATPHDDSETVLDGNADTDGNASINVE